MTLILKDPGAALDYAVDWGADYLDGDAIAQSSWSVDPIEPGGLTIASSFYDFQTATVSTSGGVAGRIYRLTNTVTLVSGQVDRRSLVIRAEQR